MKTNERTLERGTLTTLNLHDSISSIRAVLIVDITSITLGWSLIILNLVKEVQWPPSLVKAVKLFLKKSNDVKSSVVLATIFADLKEDSTARHSCRVRIAA